MKISGYSTALFSTWLNLEDLGILFDAGDGITAFLKHKSRKIKHIFISHADRDHLTGLPQLLQLNSRDGYPKIYYPADCGSFPALEQFLNKFDPHSAASEWIPIKDNEVVKINNEYAVIAKRNNHVECAPMENKSFSFLLEKRKRKLKSAHLHLSGAEIKELRQKYGEDYITEPISTVELGYSGDCSAEDPSVWLGVKTLIHESTFLRKEDTVPRGNKHSTLGSVLQLAAKVKPEHLMLTHFSSRYSKKEIDSELTRNLALYQLESQLRVLYPGEFIQDIQAEPAFVKKGE